MLFKYVEIKVYTIYVKYIDLHSYKSPQLVPELIPLYKKFEA